MIHHRAFETTAVSPLGGHNLADRERLGVLLQAAAVLAHLASSGHRLGSGWKGAGLASDGTVCLPPPEPGRDPSLPQQRLLTLLAQLFGRAEVPGRGEVRRLLRQLAASWGHSLAPLPLDTLVHDLLTAAPFLWEPAAAVARRALVAERVEGERRWLVVAGRGVLRRRLLAQATSRAEAEELLAQADASWLEPPAPARPAAELLAAGHPQAAVAAWRRQPPVDASESLLLAQALRDLGQFESALAQVAARQEPAAALLALECQIRLGELPAARALLRQLARAELTPAQTIELAELGVRLSANLGEMAATEEWVARARQAAARREGAGGGHLALRARLLAAVAAWDRGENAAVDRHLDASRAALDDPALAWRWHAAASLAARSRGDAAAGAEHLRQALRGTRRHLRQVEAGELWNELGVCRAGQGDLPGAERAFLHTVRLLGRCQGPRKRTLALYNLAEVRLRRGRLLGVREILETVTTENRLAGNVRGAIQDCELWARYELAHGRTRAALEHCREGRRLAESKGVTWRLEVLALLAARAHGWLGETDAAARALAETGPEAWAELEPEEHPAVHALAGDREGALARAASSPFLALWQGLLTAVEVASPAWQVLETLEPYRAARFILDAELVAPGGAPAPWRRRAIATFRRVGATSFAEHLEARDGGPWQALATYLAAPLDEAPPDGAPPAGSVGNGAALGELFAQASGESVRLSLIVEGEERQLVRGAGGAQEIAAPVASGGWLRLSASRLDPLLRALFHLVRRELAGSRSGATEELAVGVEAPSSSTGFIGSSPALAGALERLLRLAPSEVPILIGGESGTGKELAARAVHRASPRRHGPFVAFNCAAVNENLLLSDLFGHVRGAFTGAERERTGIFETAQDGTVFLDEIGDLPLSAQGMLLRVLQEGEVRRVGETLPRKVRVRVVAASHRDLLRMVDERTFRQDLYFRLKVGAIELPPLRARGQDVLILARHFLRKTRADRDDRGERPLRLSPAAERALLGHSWPGNVRELGNVIQVAAVLAGSESPTIEPEHLDLPVAGFAPPLGDYHRQIDDLRRHLVSTALAAAGGNRTEGARRLGLTRQAFSYLVRRFRLS